MNTSAKSVWPAASSSAEIQQRIEVVVHALILANPSFNVDFLRGAITACRLQVDASATTEKFTEHVKAVLAGLPQGELNDRMNTAGPFVSPIGAELGSNSPTRLPPLSSQT